jgi:hypothetical protein
VPGNDQICAQVYRLFRIVQHPAKRVTTRPSVADYDEPRPEDFVSIGDAAPLSVRSR